MRSWSDIEILRVIFDYCFPFVEKLKFTLVCHSWRAIVEIQFLVSQPNPPLLFLPQADDNFPASGYAYRHVNKNSCKIYNLENNEYLNLPPPSRDKWIMPKNSHVVGSCRGGCILTGKDTNFIIFIIIMKSSF